MRRPSDSSASCAPAGEPGVAEDLDAAARERAGGEARQPVGHLAEDPRRAIDEHPPRLDAVEPGVAPQRALGELLELGERLDAGEARAREDEGEPPLGGVRGGVGELDLAQHVVAQVDRVGHALEAERVLAQAGDVGEARDRAERDHEVGVGDAEAPGLGLDVDAPGLRVERDGRAEQQVGVRRHRPDRDEHVARLDRARGGLGQQRGVEHEVGRVDHGRAAVGEPAGDVSPREPAAEHERAAAGHAVAGLGVGVGVHGRRR
jgi:hypothetical protein